MSALLGVSWFAHVCGKCVFIVSLACVKLKKKGKSGLTKKKQNNQSTYLIGGW